MTIYIFFFFSLTSFAILNAIMCSTLIKYMKKINTNQHDILDILEDLTMDQQLSQDELTNIRQSINNIAYTQRNQ